MMGEMIEMYMPGNDEMSDSITQNWTEQAIECYSINCDCKKCSLSSGHYSFICQMPKVIDTLLQTVGKPEKKLKTA
uniref:Uncharacterized protein n=1 Tax=uncultured Candidatus Melainabacteria bacterium TaxID=2682970 RepID=A0A650EJJ6_9BACT|nr:hypothetical protein Melaina855_2660 [uncultured Candidatus Melainabacteria bacterium]